MVGRGSNWRLLAEVSRLLLARQMQAHLIDPATDKKESSANHNNANAQQQALPCIRAGDQKFRTLREIASKVCAENAEREQNRKAARTHCYRSNYLK